MREVQSKLLDSLDSYWQTIVDGLVAELYKAYPNSRGDTRQAIGAMNGDPISLSSQGFTVTVAMPDYYEFLDQGVHGKTSSYAENSGSPFRYTDKMPSIKSMRQFMLNRGITKMRSRPANKTTSTKSKRKLKRGGARKNTTSGRKNDLESRLNSIAFAIAKSIFNKGTKASHFYSNVINDKQIKDFEGQLLNEFSGYVVSVVKQI